ncbi:hypothetical protein ACIO14_19675 [Nocardia fluminea]|uniref:hypothetical protein n=1 Tax=Nocardia fluminea TaxID=134984 RepID=UPI00381E2E4A
MLEPLGLLDTWLFTPQTLDRYDEVAMLRHGRMPLRIPETIASFPPDGAMVSTATDQLRPCPVAAPCDPVPAAGTAISARRLARFRSD